MSVPPTDPEACYRAVAGRDARHDGRLVYGVTTTGIYCRPSCPARTPRPENCRYFPSASGAAAAGFRACRRCRPDAATAGGPEPVSDLARRALRLLADDCPDDTAVPALANRLGVSERHLSRVLLREVGAGPAQLRASRRAQVARHLLRQTSMPVADVAFAAGFASVRRFNDAVRAEFGRTPSELRREALGDDIRGEADREHVTHQGPGLLLRLAYRPPLAAGPLQRFLAAHAVPGLERHEPPDPDDHVALARHTRVLPGPGGPALVTVTLPRPARPAHPPGQVLARVLPAAPDDLGHLVVRLRQWLGLDTDPEQVDRALAADPLLAPLVAARPGLRVPGAADGVETALLAVLGQQVSLAAARTFAGKLVAAFGRAAPDGLRAFPSAAALADAGPDALRAATGVTGARARTLHAVASAAADGLDLTPQADPAEARARLLALPGVGPWTAEYVALRSLGDPDAFPADDLVLKRALGVRTAREAAARAAPWRPWRGSALLHLWTREVFA